MEDEACNSTKADQQSTVTEQYNDQFWTKISKDMPNFTHEHIEKRLILEKDKTRDKKTSWCRSKGDTDCSRQVMQFWWKET